MQIPRLFAFSLTILLALIGGAKAQEQIFEKYNFAITPPEGWTLKEDPQLKPGLLATFDKPDKTASFSITVDTNGFAPAVLDDAFIREFNLEAGETGSGKFLSGTFVNAHGVKCYERKGAGAKTDAPTSTFMQVVSANGILYSLLATRVDGDAGDLPEVRKSIASFRFLKQPITPPPVEKKSAAYNAQYFLGQNAAIIAPVSLVSLVLIVIMVTAFVKNSARRSRRGGG